MLFLLGVIYGIGLIPIGFFLFVCMANGMASWKFLVGTFLWPVTTLPYIVWEMTRDWLRNK